MAPVLYHHLQNFKTHFHYRFFAHPFEKAESILKLNQFQDLGQFIVTMTKMLNFVKLQDQFQNRQMNRVSKIRV